MKHFFALVFCSLFGGSLWAASIHPTSANPFQDDLTCLDEAFGGINELEQLVESQHATYSELASEQNPLLHKIKADHDIASSLIGSAAPEGEKLLGIPGFCWGFCFGLIGVLLVYVAVDGEAGKREGRQAILGCVVGAVLGVIVYVVAVASTQ